MKLFKYIKQEMATILERDPAARSKMEVFFCYPGFHALIFYRVANKLWRSKLYFLGRFVSHTGRFFTGIEIHPGAKIGTGVFIDHGMGLVIGETAEIGNNVTLYHGVTLGGVSLKKEKRHPTIEDNVLVGAGAKILGPFTVGKGSQVGANSVVVKAVPPGSTVVGIPAVPTGQHNDPSKMQHDHLQDPTGHKIAELLMRIEKLENDNMLLREQLTDKVERKG